MENVGNSDRAMGAPKLYNAVFTDKKNNDAVQASDFLNLMIAQMRNQDFLNPMDDTQFITQMAQFTTMQQMMELAEWSKSNYAMSLVGKTVTASRFNVSGGLDTVTGVVEKLSFVDNEYLVHIGENRYNLNQVMEVHSAMAAETKETDEPDEAEVPEAIDPTDTLLDTVSKSSLISGIATADAAVVFWNAPSNDEEIASQLRYTVYYSTEGPFDTVEDVKNGELSGAVKRADIQAATIVGLESGVSYYINVVVTAADGKEAVFKPVRVTTEIPAVPAAAGTTGYIEEEEDEEEETEALEAPDTEDASTEETTP